MLCPNAGRMYLDYPLMLHAVFVLCPWSCVLRSKHSTLERGIHPSSQDLCPAKVLFSSIHKDLEQKEP